MTNTYSGEQSTVHYRPLDRVFKDEKEMTAGDDLLALPREFIQSALHTAIQSPLNSLQQMLPCGGGKHLPHLQLVDAAEAAPEFSPRWQAQMLGAAAGAGADIVLLDVAARGTLPPAALGAIYDGLLRPVDESDNSANQWQARAKNAAIGGVGFGLMKGTNSFLQSCGKETKNLAWSNICHNEMARSTLAGIPAGLATTAMSGGKNLHDFAVGTYTSAITGFGLGAVHAAAERQSQNCNRVHKSEIENLKSALETDYLTGQGNRRSSDLFLQKEFGQSIRTGRPLSVIYGDLDGFKAVNDKISHQAGDEILQKVGQLLRQNLRAYDHVARTGGDEFTLILPETDHKTALTLAHRLQDEINLTAGEGKTLQKVGISLGVVTRLPGEVDIDDFRQRADAEMYKNKAQRKGAN